MQYSKLPIISHGFIQIFKGFLGRFIRVGGGGELEAYNQTKKSVFKTRYIAVLIKILFEFNYFVKLQNILKSQIHFNTSLKGAYNRVYFFI